MAENFEYKLRVELEDNVSQALSGMGRNVQNAFSSITRTVQQSISPTRTLRNELTALNSVLSRTQQQNKSISQSYSQLTNNIFTLRKALQEAKNAAKVLSATLDAVNKAKRESSIALRSEISKGAAADRDKIKATQQQIKALRDLEKQIKNVKSSYDALGSNSIRLQFATLNKDIGLLGKSFIDFGKNLNYVGRNLTFALTIPLVGFIQYGINNLRKLDKEVVRTRKILDDAFSTPAELDTFMNSLGANLDNLSYKVTDSYKGLGIARELVQGLAADFAQLGVQPEQIFGLVRLSAELEKIGDVEIGVAKEFVLSAYQQAIRVQNAALVASGGIIDAAKVSETAIAQVTGALYQLNVIENKTVLSLKSIADAFPEMQGVATTFGLTMLEVTSMFAPMIAAGFEVGASANSIKVSLQRIVAPTKQNKEMMNQLNKEFGTNFQFNAGIGLDTIQQLVDGFATLEKSSYGTQGALEFFARLFGVRQGPRMEQSIRQLAQFQDQLRNTQSDTSVIFSTIAKNINQELSKIGISKKFSTDTIVAIGEITRYSAEAQQSGNQAVVDAIIKGQEQAVASLESTYGDFYQKISNEAGKVLAAQALGPEQAKKIYEKELEAANNTVEAKLGRARETFKALSVQLVPIFVDIVEAILPTLQRLTDWIANLPKDSKKMIALGLAFLAALGPLTTFVATISQIAGVTMRIFSAVMPKLFGFLKLPKSIGSSLADASKGFDTTNNRMGIFARLVDRLTDRMPRLGNAIDFAFGGLGNVRNDLIRIGENVATFGSRKGVMSRALLYSLLKDAGTNRTDIDKLTRAIVDLTTDSWNGNARRRIKPASDMKAMFLDMLGYGGIQVFQKELKNLANIESYTTTYVREATKQLGLQTKASAKKATATKALGNKVSLASLDEKRLKEEIQDTTEAINKSSEATDETVVSKKRNKRTKSIAPVFTGSAYEKAFRDQLAASGIDVSMLGAQQKMATKLTAEGGGTVDDILNKASEQIEEIKEAAIEAASAPIDDLTVYKDKLLNEFAGLSRKGPKGISGRLEKIKKKAQKLGFGDNDPSVLSILDDFSLQANDLTQKVSAAADDVAKTIVKTPKLNNLQSSVYRGFLKRNSLLVQMGREIDDQTTIIQREIVDVLSTVDQRFHKETLKTIESGIAEGKIFNLDLIQKQLENQSKIDNPTWKQFFGGGRQARKNAAAISSVFGRTNPLKQLMAPVSERIRNIFGVGFAQIGLDEIDEDLLIKQLNVGSLGTGGLGMDLKTTSEYQRIILSEIRKSMPDLETGSMKDFESAIYKILWSGDIGEKEKAKALSLARGVMSSTSGESYISDLIPQRKKLLDMEIESLDSNKNKLRALGQGYISSQMAKGLITPDQALSLDQKLFDAIDGLSVEKNRIVSNLLQEIGITDERLLKDFRLIEDSIISSGVKISKAEQWAASTMPIPKTLTDLEDIALGIDAASARVGGEVVEKVGKNKNLLSQVFDEITRVRFAREIGQPERQFRIPLVPPRIGDSGSNDLFNQISRGRAGGLIGRRRGILAWKNAPQPLKQIISSFKDSFGLMSMLPVAGLGAALTGMADAPGGLLGKLFGGGAGAAAMAAAGGVDKDALKKAKPRTILDEVVKRRGLKGKDASALKKLIIDRFTGAGQQAWLDVLLNPIDSIKDELKKSIANIPEKGSVKSTASAKKIAERLKGTGVQLRNGVEEAVQKTAKLVDDVVDGGPAAIDKIIANIEKTTQASAKRVAEATEPVKRGQSKKAVTEKTQKRRARQAAKAKAASAAAEGVAEAASDAAEEVAEAIAVQEKKTPKGKAKAAAVKAGDEIWLDSDAAAVVAAEQVSEAASDAAEQTWEEVVKESVVAKKRKTPKAKAAAAEAVAETEVNSELAQTAAASSIKDDVCELTDDIKEQIIVALMTITGTMVPSSAIATSAVAEIEQGLAQVGLAYNKSLKDLIDDYTASYTGAALASGAFGGGGVPVSPFRAFMGRFDDESSRTARVFASLRRGLSTPLTSLTRQAGYASMGIGKLGSSIFAFIPIFGKMIGQGMVNRGRASIQAGQNTKSYLDSVLIGNRELSKTSLLIRKVGVDLGAAGASIFQLVNPLKMIGGVIKSIMTGLKFALALTGIGIVLAAIAAAIVAIKGAIQNFEPIIAKLKEAWKYISEALMIIAKPLMDMILGFAGAQKGAADTGDAVADSANSTKSAVAVVVGFIVFISKKFRENAEKIAKFVKEKVIPVFIQIINIVILIGKIIIEVFSGSFGEAGTASKELFMRIGYGLLNLIKAVLPVIREFLKVGVIAFAKLSDFIVTSIIKAIDAAFSYAWSKAGSFIKTAGSWIANTLTLNPTSSNSLWGWGGSLLKSGWDWLTGSDGKEKAKEGSNFFSRMMEKATSHALSGGIQDALANEGSSISDFLFENMSFSQGWIGDIADTLLGVTDSIFDGLLGVVDKAIDSIAKDFQEQFGKPISAPIDLTPPEVKEEMNNFIKDLTAEIGTALNQSGEELGQEVGGAIQDALKEVQQRFVDLVVDYLGDAISKYKTQLQEILEEQKEKQLQYFDDQIAAIEALEKAEEELTEAVEYETGRRRMIEERDLQRANYQRNRALAIYEGRVDDARTMDLEEEKNTIDFRENIDKYDKDRSRTLQQRQRETVKQILEEQKKDAEKAFDEIIKNYEKFVEEIGKHGTYTQEELTEQFEKIRHEAAKATAGMQTSFREYYLAIPKIIQQYTDPTVGFFSEPLDKLIAIAKTKFGLGADSGASADSILGNTAALMRQIGQTFTDQGPTAGQSFEQAFSDVITNYVVPIVNKLNDAFNEFDPAAIFKKAVDEANETLRREEQKLIDGLNSLVKGMIGLLDPAIAKWAALKAAIEAASGAASSAGGGGGGGGFDPGQGVPALPAGFESMYSSAFRRLFPTSYFGAGSEGTRFQQIAYSGALKQLQPLLLDLKSGKYTLSTLLGYLAPDTGYNKILRKLLTDYAFINQVFPSGPGGLTSAMNGGSIRRYGSGGFAVPGFRSTPVPALLHGGEFVVNAKAVSNIGLAALQAMNNMRFASPGRMQAPSSTTINETRNVNIYVDNFIGQEQWFESMMKEYNIKVVPRNQKTAGLEMRTVSSYSGINRGM